MLDKCRKILKKVKDKPGGNRQFTQEENLDFRRNYGLRVWPSRKAQL
jgi:hypothetical protein